MKKKRSASFYTAGCFIIVSCAAAAQAASPDEQSSVQSQSELLRSESLLEVSRSKEKSLQSKIETLDAALVAKEESIAQMMALSQQDALRLQQAKETIKEQNSKIQKLRDQHTMASSRDRNLQDMLQRALRDKKTGEDECARLTALLQKSRQDYRGLQQEREGLLERIKDAQVSVLQAEGQRQVAEKKLSQAQSEIDRLVAQKDALRQEISGLKIRLQTDAFREEEASARISEKDRLIRQLERSVVQAAEEDGKDDQKTAQDDGILPR